MSCRAAELWEAPGLPEKCCAHSYCIPALCACISIMFQHIMRAFLFFVCAFLLYFGTVCVHFYFNPALFYVCIFLLLDWIAGLDCMFSTSLCVYVCRLIKMCTLLYGSTTCIYVHGWHSWSDSKKCHQECHRTKNAIGPISIGLLSLRLYGIRISTHTHMHTYTHAHAHPHNNYASQLAARTYNYASQLAAHTYNWSILGSPKCLQNRFNHQTNLQTSLADSCMFCFVLVWG